ncbi:MAG: ABC transporter ATP-binding protein [Gemmatimonadales bacterium]
MTATQLYPTPLVARAESAPDIIVAVEGLTKRFPVQRGWRSMFVRRGISAEYVQALDRVSLEIRRRELFGVLGPNGAGKTTLFKLLSTLIVPDGGTAIIAGHDLVRDPARVRTVLAPSIADERSLNWRVSAHENLRFYAALYGLQGRSMRERVGQVLETVELAEAGGRMVGTFSSGMKQRLLIARALLPAPKVLLLDEPTRSLDPVAARRFRSFLREHLVAEQGCTVLLATHNTEEALELCDRVAILDRGRVLEVGAAGKLSRELGGQRYRARARRFEPSVIEILQGAGLIGEVQRREQLDGWEIVDFIVPGGDERAADVLAALVRQGTPLAGFEPLPVTLADVIEQAVRRGQNSSREGGLGC